MLSSLWPMGYRGKGKRWHIEAVSYLGEKKDPIEDQTARSANHSKWTIVRTPGIQFNQ